MPVALSVTVSGASGGSEHVLELRETSAGEQASKLQYCLDGKCTGLADWARIGPGLYSILLGGRSYEARVSRSGSPPGAREYDVRLGAEHFRVSIRDPRARRASTSARKSAGPLQITAPMPGKVMKLLVSEGEEVVADQGLLVMEAMKMQNEMRAPRAGRVERIQAAVGVGVETGSPLLRLA